MANYGFNDGVLTGFSPSNDIITFPPTVQPTSIQFLADPSNPANSLIVATVYQYDSYLTKTMTIAGVSLSSLQGSTFSGGGNAKIYIGASTSNTVYGTQYNDILYGGSGSDTIYGLGGNDVIYGGSFVFDPNDGADYIDGGAGNDIIYGNGGNDTIIGSAGNDSVHGGGGNDSIDYSASSDSVIISGNSGNDTIIGGSGSDTIYGASGGNNSLIGGAGNDYIYGMDGNDYIEGNQGADLIYGDAGSDTIIGTPGGGNDTVSGGIGNDSINYTAETVTSARPVIYGNAGSDTIIGSSGNDIIYGGSNSADDVATDADIIDGGAGNDTIYGSGGGDIITGSSGSDLVYGGGGNDSINYSGLIAVGSTLYGQDGNDTITGSPQADSLYGDNGTIESGSDGADVIIGNGGNDLFYGNGGNDTITGGAGNDTIYGGSGNDSLSGLTGNDQVYGDDGADIVVVTSIAAWPNVTLVGGTSTGSDINPGDSISFGSLPNITIAPVNLTNVSGFENIVTYGATSNDAITITDSYAQTLTLSSGTRTLANSYNAAVTTGTMSFDGSGVTSTYNVNLSLTGGAASDTLIGGAGADTINGSSTITSVGADSLVGGAGNDVIIGNAGADTINGGSGADSMSGNAGNDLFLFTAANFNEGTDTVVGGTGTDTLKFTDTDVASLTTTTTSLSGVDAMLFYGTGSAHNVTLNNSFIATSDNNSIAFSYQNVQSGTVIFDASSVSSTVASVSFNAIGAGLTNTATLIGGAGPDTLVGSSAANSITGNGGDDSIVGGAGNDTLSGGLGADSIAGSGGNDLFRYLAAEFAESLDTIDGGVGSDTIIFTDADVGTIVAGNLAHSTGIDNVKFFGSGSAHSVTLPNAFVTSSDSNAVAFSYQNVQSGTVTFDASAVVGVGSSISFNNSGAGITGAATITGGAGPDTLVASSGAKSSISGNTGADAIYIKSTYLQAGNASTINGNAGNDTIFLLDTLGVTIPSAGFANVSHVETIQIPSNANSNSITLNSMLSSDASALTITVSNPTLVGTGNCTINAGGDAVTTDSFIIIGGVGSGVGFNGLIGGAGPDTIIGSSGVEFITGNTGADSLVGGPGDDGIFMDIGFSFTPSPNADIYSFNTTTDFVGIQNGDALYSYAPGTTMVDFNGGGTLQDGLGNTSAALTTYNGVADTFGFLNDYASIDLTATGGNAYIIEIDPHTNTFAPAANTYSQANIDAWGTATFTAGKLTDGSIHHTNVILIVYSASGNNASANAGIMELTHTAATTSYSNGDLKTIAFVYGLTLDGSGYGPFTSVDFV